MTTRTPETGRRQEPPRYARDAVHSVVYRNDAQFCGWPFYCGLWQLRSGELIAGFKRIPNSYRDTGEVSHTLLTVGQGDLVLIRSYDGGQSWDGSQLQSVFRLGTSIDWIKAMGPETYEPEGPFEGPEGTVLFMSGGLPALLKADSRAWLMASDDGGHGWRRPMLLPLCGLGSLTGHGSSSLRSDGMHLIGLSTTSPDGWTHRPLVYASTDGIDWRFLSFITPAIEGGSAVTDRSVPAIYGATRHFYPRLAETADGRILASLRFQRDARDVIWTDIFASDDGGRTWAFLSRVNDWGAPGDIVAMHDGRIACVYGYRVRPYGIRARISETGGRTWGPEFVLRDDGGSWDLGYPRVIEHEPGKLLTVYYMNCKGDPIQMNGGVRHIAQTVFTPE
jgi:hypothetical protein